MTRTDRIHPPNALRRKWDTDFLRRQCYLPFCEFTSTRTLCTPLRHDIYLQGKIFVSRVQVPSGLAVGGSLLSGVTTADWIVSEQTGTTAIEDITSAQGVAFSVTLSVVQVAISASVGLSLATLFAYPLSRQKSHNMGFTSF